MKPLRNFSYSLGSLPLALLFVGILAYGIHIAWMAFYWDDWIQIQNFSFRGNNRDIELRIGDDRIEDKTLVSVLRLKDIGRREFKNVELRLDLPDWLEDMIRDYKHNFICILVYDNDKREVLGKYYLKPPLDNE